jgi:hypothetical protein
MTLDFMLGFASPFAPIVKLDPRGIRSWLFFAMFKRLTAQDGYVVMTCLRLIGITIGCTFTIACTTSATPAASASQSAPQLSAQQQAAIFAAMQAQAGKAPLSPASPLPLDPTATTKSTAQ